MATLRNPEIGFLACLVAILIGLAVEIALSLGYGFEKWSTNSLSLGLLIAACVGLLVIPCIYFGFCAFAKPHLAERNPVAD